MKIAKTCTRCGELKPMDEFYRNPTTRGGHLSACKPCHIAQCRKYQALNPEKTRARTARYSAANREAIRERSRDHNAALGARSAEQIEADRARLRPDGLKRCSGCREYLPFETFSRDAQREDGLRGVCRPCRNRRARQKEASRG